MIQLPRELVRNILHLLDPETFYACMLTCQTLRDHALASKKLVVDQLDKLPGWRHYSIGDPHYLLLQELRLRAAKHLLHGGVRQADVHTFQPTTLTDWKASLVVPCCEETWPPASERKQDMIITEIRKADAIVNIYVLKKDDEKGYQPQFQYVIPPSFLYSTLPKERWDWKYKISKVVLCEQGDNPIHGASNLCSRRMAILYETVFASKPRAESRPNTWANWIVNPHPRRVMELLIFKFDEDFGPIVVQKFSFKRRLSDEVVALAVSKELTPLVLYRTGFNSDRYIVSFPASDPDTQLTQLTLDPNEGPDETIPYSSSGGWVSGVTVIDNVALFSPSVWPIARWKIDDIQFAVNEWSRGTRVPLIAGWMGHVLRTWHHHRLEDPQINGGHPSCINTALQLVLSRPDHRVPGRDDRRYGAFLVKAVQGTPSMTCKAPLNPLIDELNLDHIYVAYLAGLDIANISTLGLRVAVSPRTCRIAVANWKQVLVWAVDPAAFLDPGLLTEGPDMTDCAYTVECGWEYYSCNDRTWDEYAEMIVLEPLQLPEAGAVYSLEFRSEDELWGWTEKGLVKWSFSTMAKGNRELSILE